MLCNRERETHTHTQKTDVSLGELLRFFLNFLFRVFGTFRVLAEKKKRGGSRYFLREKKYLKKGQEGPFWREDDFIFFRFVSVFSTPLDDLGVGKRMCGDDDEMLTMRVFARKKGVVAR